MCISNYDSFSTSFYIYGHYSITCLLSDILCTTTTVTLRNGENLVNFMTFYQKHISFSLIIIISSIWCIETHIQCLIHTKILWSEIDGSWTQYLIIMVIRTLTQCLTLFLRFDINSSSYSFGAIKLKSIVLPTMRLNLKPSK